MQLWEDYSRSRHHCLAILWQVSETVLPCAAETAEYRELEVAALSYFFPSNLTQEQQSLLFPQSFLVST